MALKHLSQLGYAEQLLQTLAQVDELQPTFLPLLQAGHVLMVR